jgi:argininosuccinate synthase
MAYAKKWKIPVSSSKKKPWSMDRNLLHLSFEGGILEDPWASPPEEMFLLTKSPKSAPDREKVITIDYKKGNPVAVDGKKMSPAKLLAHLNKLAGQNGIGRVDLVENRYVGMKSRGVYETPGGTILHAAHRAVESLTLDREVLKLRDSLIPEYTEMVYNGYWFAPEREVLQVMMDEIQQPVTGTVRVGLYKGNITVLGRKAPKSLFDPRFATFEEDDVYNQADAEGFIKLNALRLKIRAMVNKGR